MKNRLIVCRNTEKASQAFQKYIKTLNLIPISMVEFPLQQNKVIEYSKDLVTWFVSEMAPQSQFQGRRFDEIIYHESSTVSKWMLIEQTCIQCPQSESPEFLSQNQKLSQAGINDGPYSTISNINERGIKTARWSSDKRRDF